MYDAALAVAASERREQIHTAANVKLVKENQQLRADLESCQRVNAELVRELRALRGTKAPLSNHS